MLFVNQEDSVEFDAYKEAKVKRKKKRIGGGIEVRFKLCQIWNDFKAIIYILKTIRNVGLYKLIPYLSQFNRKPTICGLTTGWFIFLS